MLEKAKAKFRIRPFEMSDYDTVIDIFTDGMLEYSDKGTNVRKQFLPVDHEHKKFLDQCEVMFKEGYNHYVEWSLKDANLSKLPDYWSLPRRSIFLVCECLETGEIAGTVALQPVELINDWYATQCKQHQNNIKLVGLSTLNQIQYASGNLPSELYSLDDPNYDPESFRQPLPTVIPPHGAEECDSTPPRANNIASVSCTCREENRCSSNAIQVLSRYTLEAGLKHLHSCPCIIRACAQDVPPSEYCSFCIQDAKYLHLPYQRQPDQTASAQPYAPTSEAMSYRNQLSVSVQDRSIHPHKYTLKRFPERLSFYYTAPPGFFRRFQPSFDFGLPLPSGLPIDCYEQYIRHARAPGHSTMSPSDGLPYDKTQPYSYTSYLAIDPSLPLASHSDADYSECELRRMSVAKKFRSGSGVAQFLIFSALQVARVVFHFDMVHLSTSTNMDIAVKFYRQLGFRESHNQFEYDVDLPWPCVHYQWALTPDGRDRAPLRFSHGAMFNDYDPVELQHSSKYYHADNLRD